MVQWSCVQPEGFKRSHTCRREIPDMHKRIAICIPTYKRPDGLRRLLAALALQEIPAGCEVRIVVVDNEGALQTKQICEESASDLMVVPLIYCCERRRGISQVRNKAVEEARQVADFLVFIDDDEVPFGQVVRAPDCLSGKVRRRRCLRPSCSAFHGARATVDPGRAIF